MPFSETEAQVAAWEFDAEPAILRAVGAVVKTIMRTDPSRFYLHGIKLEQAGDRAVAIATNGHVMTQADWEAPDAIREPFILPLSCVPTIGGGPTGRGGPSVHESTKIRVDGDNVTSETEVRGKPTMLQAGRVVDGSFPEWRRVFTVPEDDQLEDGDVHAHHAGYACRYLKVVTETARLAGIETMCLRMPRGKRCSEGPSLWYGQSTYGPAHIRILQMPVRYDDDADIPWQAPPLPE